MQLPMEMLLMALRKPRDTKNGSACHLAYTQHFPSSPPLNPPRDMYAKISVKICTHYRLSKVILVD